MSRRIVALVSALGLAILLIPSVAAASPVTVKVMTLNIFYGGDEWNLETGQWCRRPAGCKETMQHVLATIEAADPDIIGFQEATANECVFADMLGWFCEPRLQLISRFPLIDPPGANGVYALAEVTPGRFVAISNVHLPSDPYGPYWVRDGEPRAVVLDLERSTRLPAIQRELAVLPGLAASGSRCSSRATQLAVASRLDARGRCRKGRGSLSGGVAGVEGPGRCRLPRLLPRGASGSVEVPGFTWTPPGTLESVPDEVHDRIDWVLVQGPAETTGTKLVGEAGGPDVTWNAIPIPPITVASCRRSASCPPIRHRSRRPRRGGSSPARTSPCGSTAREPASSWCAAGTERRRHWCRDRPAELPTAFSGSRPAVSSRARTSPSWWTGTAPSCPAVLSGSTGPGRHRASGRRRWSTRSASRSACGGGPRPGTGSIGWGFRARARPRQERGELQRGNLRQRALPAVPLHGGADRGFRPHRAGVIRGLSEWRLKVGRYEIGS